MIESAAAIDVSYNAEVDRSSCMNLGTELSNTHLPLYFDCSPHFLSSHILLSPKCCPQRNFCTSSKQLPAPPSIICCLPDQTSPSLMLLYTFSTLLFLRTFFSFGPSFHFSPLCSFSSQLYCSHTFAPNRVLIFFYSLILSASSFFYSFSHL